MTEESDSTPSSESNDERPTKNNQNSKIIKLKKIIRSIKNDKQLLISTILAITLISMGTASSIFALGISVELSQTEWADEKIPPELTSLLVNFAMELIFGAVFIWWGISILRRAFLKVLETEKLSVLGKPELDKIQEPPKIKESKFSKIKNTLRRNPKYRIFLYVVLLPFVYAILILFSGSILNKINSNFEIPLMTFQNYVLYLFLLFIAIIHKGYIQTYKKMKVEDQFELLGYDYIIKERQILEKIPRSSFILFILVTSILLAYLITNPASNNTDENKLDPYALILLAISFGFMLVIGATSVKMKIDNTKKQFRTYVAMGFLQAGLKAKEELIDYLNYGLQSYSNFFKQNHQQKIKNIQQIIVEIISKKDSEKITIIQNIIKSLKSDNNYDALNTISKLMNVKSYELLTPDTVILKIKDWGLFLATVVILIFTILLFWKP